MRALSFVALIIGVLLIPTALGVAKIDRDRDVSELERTLVAETDEHGGALESYFARARAIVLLTANSPAFANVLAEPGTRVEKVRPAGAQPPRGHAPARLPRAAVPEQHRRGVLHRRRRRGVRARRARRRSRSPAISPPTRSRRSSSRRPSRCAFGQVHQTRPYVSPDTNEWVVANATLIPQADGRKRAFVHFEVTVESFRREMGASSVERGNDYELRVIDGRTGRVVIDGARPQRVGAALGDPRDARFASLARDGRVAGVTEVAGRRTAFRRIALDARATPTTGSSSPAPTRRPAASSRASAPVPIAMLAVALLIIALAGGSLRAARRELECARQLGRPDGARQPPQAPRRPRPPGRRRTAEGPSC